MGFLSKFFEYTLKKNLAKDKSLQQALAEGDKALDDFYCILLNMNQC